MKTIITLALAFVLGCLAVQVFADSPKLSPEQQAIVDAETQLVEARKAEALKREQAKATARAEWDALTVGQAWARRGQSVVDAGQYGVGQASRGLCNADGYLGTAVAFPSAYLTAAAFSGAEASKQYASTAWDNTPKSKTEVAVKVGDKEVKAPETK